MGNNHDVRRMVAMSHCWLQFIFPRKTSKLDVIIHDCLPNVKHALNNKPI